jgi:uncharacterized protein
MVRMRLWSSKMSLPIIVEPLFYVFAIPAVLLIGVSKSGFGAGLGALAVPMMALTVTVPQAAAILMPVLLVIDVLGIAAFRKDFDRALLKFLLPWALLGTVIGTLLFKSLDSRMVAGTVGVSTLLFLAQRQLFPSSRDARPPPKWLGAILATTSGFTSFISHAGGPPLSAYVIPLKLPPLRFTATMAFLFFAVNLSKWIPYAWLGLIEPRNMATSLVLLPFAPMGVWAGVRIARRIDEKLFYRLVHGCMLVAGCKLVWDGFLAGLI